MACSNNIFLYIARAYIILIYSAHILLFGTRLNNLWRAHILFMACTHIHIASAYNIICACCAHILLYLYIFVARANNIFLYIARAYIIIWSAHALIHRLHMIYILASIFLLMPSAYIIYGVHSHANRVVTCAVAGCGAARFFSCHTGHESPRGCVVTWFNQ